jgi:aspartate kinase
VSQRLSVLKLGGSVLRDDASYGAAAHFLQARLALNQDERLVVIVSAPYGMTDRLLHEAESIVYGTPCREGRRGPQREALGPEPPRSGGPNGLDDVALDLLWSTGELRSVALLALHLQAIGTHAVAFNVHQTGLVAERAERPARTAARPLRLLAALAHARIVIVPGFLGVSAGGTITSLGRGGSDLTAVLLADAVRADACELIKDVPGYFTADPHRRADARPIHDLSFDEALRMADAGCDLVQRAALAAAGTARLPLVIRSMDAAAPITTVYPLQEGKDRSRHHGVRHQDDSRGPAVGA